MIITEQENQRREKAQEKMRQEIRKAESKAEMIKRAKENK